MRRAGLGDALGIVVSLTALAYFPMQVDPASFPKLMLLVIGGLAVAPFVLLRWLAPSRPSSWALVPCIAGAALLLWSTLGTVLADAPWPTRLFGWFLRADGLLAIVAACILLLGAATLDRDEVQRAIAWVVTGSAVAALLAVPQVLGSEFMAPQVGTVTSTFGQTNFSGAYFAISAVLALGLSLVVTSVPWRIANLAVALACAYLAFRSDALQGPMSLAAGLVMLGFGLVLAYRGRHRAALLASSVVVLALGLFVAVLGMLAIGPLGFVGRDGNTTWRYAMWSQGWDTMNGHPIVGIGTGSFARYLSEFRSLESTIRVGEGMRPSAVHSIPLQFGIVGGWPALLLWIALFASVLVLLMMRIGRSPLARPALGAVVLGALSGYVTQAIVSIDVPPILAIGWLLAGLAVALVRDPLPLPETPARVRPEAAVEVVPARTLVKAFTASIVLALLGGWAVWSQIQAVERVRNVASADVLFAALADPMTPCAVRMELANSSLPGLPLREVVPAIRAAVAVDPRCPPVINLQSSVALAAGAVWLADESTSLGTTLDPQAVASWALRKKYFDLAGDAAGAAGAQAQLDRINKAAADAAAATAASAG